MYSIIEECSENGTIWLKDSGQFVSCIYPGPSEMTISQAEQYCKTTHYETAEIIEPSDVDIRISKKKHLQ